MKKHGQRTRTYRSPEYVAWVNMKDRCNNPNHKRYADYGGRGIRVCERWANSFEDFFADMGTKPTPRHSLDRHPDNDGDYTPYNCRWATFSEQGSNKRPRTFIEYKGEVKSIAQWSKELGIQEGTIAHRHKIGMDIGQPLKRISKSTKA